MRAIILSIGDELTLGQTLDTNSQWLSAQLAERSIMVIEHRTVADDRDAMAAAIGQSIQRCDVLITSGGLGPTEDDLTREAIGDVVTPGEALVDDVQAREHLQNWFARRGRSMPVMNFRQAQRPRTFRCVPNPNGTAPGIAGTHDGRLIFCLPGPPREMQPMFRDHVVPALPVNAGEAILTARVQEFGMGESVAAEKLGELMRRDRNPLVGTTASESIVSARIRAQGRQDATRQALDEIVARVWDVWQPYAFAHGDESLSHSTGKMLLERGLTLATAESCTGGLLGKLLVDVPGSSAYYLGGWVTYSNDLKTSQLGVPPDLIDRVGAVSREVAAFMALGALERGGADCALAITGVAGPDGGSNDKPVGTVFIALALRASGATQVRRFEFPGERGVIRDRAAKAALQMLRFALLDVSDTPLIWEAARPVES